MNQSILLCADEACVSYPETIGLAGENILEQPWLCVIGNAYQARTLWQKTHHICEMWVVSADDMEAINVAAACKADRPDAVVNLVSFASSGSIKSRANRAGIDSVYNQHDFVLRYTQAKQAYLSGEMGVPKKTDAPNKASAPKVANSSGVASYSSAADDSNTLKPSNSPSVSSDLPSFDTPQTPSHTQKALRALRTENRAFFLPIVSGSGGCGKSTVAVLCAQIAQNRGYKTLLLDMDMQFGDAAVLLGMRNCYCLDQVAKSPDLLDALTPTDEKPVVIAAPHKMESGESLQPYLAELLQHALSHFDVVIANTGSFWTDQHVALLEQASKALFLIDQRPSSLRACRHALELCARCGVAANPFVLGVNRCQKAAIYSSLDVSCAMQGMKAVELQDGGSEVEECLAAGQPQELIKGQNELCKSIDQVLSTMLPHAERHAACFKNQQKRKTLHLFGRQVWGREAACL